MDLDKRRCRWLGHMCFKTKIGTNLFTNPIGTGKAEDQSVWNLGIIALSHNQRVPTLTSFAVVRVSVSTALPSQHSRPKTIVVEHYPGDPPAF